MMMNRKKNCLIVLAAAGVLSVATAVSAVTFQVDLNYNFNGIVHAGEDGMPDNPDGYRSISDRGLNFSGGVPSDATVDNYNSGRTRQGSWTSFTWATGTRWQVQLLPLTAARWRRRRNPAELAGNPDQSGTQTTVLGTPVLLDGSSAASFLYQISDGGGNFDVRFGFSSGGDVVSTIGGGDWFGGPYAGTDRVDFGNLFGAGLFIVEGVVDLSGEAGRTLTSIGFENRSNTNAGYAILAGNVEGVPEPSTGILLLIGLAACFRRVM